MFSGEVTVTVPLTYKSPLNRFVPCVPDIVSEPRPMMASSPHMPPLPGVSGLVRGVMYIVNCFSTYLPTLVVILTVMFAII